MLARNFVPVFLLLLASAAPAWAVPLSYSFGNGSATQVICRAPNSGAPAPTDCPDTVSIQPIGGGLPVNITALPTAGPPDNNAYGGIGVFGFGIGAGTDGDGPAVGPSPGKQRISAGIVASQTYSEHVRISFDLPVYLKSISVRSVATRTDRNQIIRILDSQNVDATGNLRFRSVASTGGRVTTFQFGSSLLDSTFLVDPVFMLDDAVAGGFYITDVDVFATPVPPALPLLGGAVALLFWRGRRVARRAAAA